MKLRLGLSIVGLLMASVPGSADVYIQQIDPRATPGGSIGGETPAYLLQLPLGARAVPQRSATRQQPRQPPAVARSEAEISPIPERRDVMPDVGSGVAIAISNSQEALPDVGSGVGRR